MVAARRCLYYVGVVTAADRGDLAGQGLTHDTGGEAWSLPAGEVHVWTASLERSTERVAQMRGLLASDERHQADRFRFERDRARYTVGRALLRALLSRYVQAPPADLDFEYGEYRKPMLAHGPWFNVSHSGPTALFAFTSATEIGVDVELDHADFARERIAERFFSPSEVHVLRSLPADAQPRAFLTCWTRKEAFIKARGDGLSLPLDSFDVTLAPNVPAGLLRTAWCKEEPRRWWLQDLSDPDDGYIAALAARCNGLQVVQRRITETMEGCVPGQENT
jgi:4'-phosphopantetheinyl transferase